MNKILIVIVILLIVLIAVVLYNMHQENQYRKKIRSQFGHADQDALMDSRTVSVRDGQSFGGTEEPVAPLRRAPVKPIEDTPLFAEIKPAAEPVKAPADKEETVSAMQTVVQTEEKSDFPPEAAAEAAQTKHSGTTTDDAPQTAAAAESVRRQTQSELLFEPFAEARRFRIDPAALAQLELAWFDKRFDYTAYVALPEPQQLQSIPRFSGSRRFQIIGNTLDGRFQAAEPIPGVLYQAFVIGLQAISRSGLADEQDLREFEQQAERFAAQFQGSVEFADRKSFLAQARAWDDMCARVDQTIAIHLVRPGSNISGTELRQALENKGFMLQNDGAFAAAAEDGSPTFAAVPLDNGGFTEALLASQPYKGFSMLFDITRIDGGETRFDQFIGLAVNLAEDLELDLVDDQIQPLSAQWLKEVRSYVGLCQQEMAAAGIKPGSALAKRLFS